MELLALDKPIKKPPRSDERDGELFCGTNTLEITVTASHKVTDADKIYLSAVTKKDNSTYTVRPETYYSTSTYGRTPWNISGFVIEGWTVTAGIDPGNQSGYLSVTLTNGTTTFTKTASNYYNWTLVVSDSVTFTVEGDNIS